VAQAVNSSKSISTHVNSAPRPVASDAPQLLDFIAEQQSVKQPLMLQGQKQPIRSTSDTEHLALTEHKSTFSEIETALNTAGLTDPEKQEFEHAQMKLVDAKETAIKQEELDQAMVGYEQIMTKALTSHVDQESIKQLNEEFSQLQQDLKVFERREKLSTELEEKVGANATLENYAAIGYHNIGLSAKHQLPGITFLARKNKNHEIETITYVLNAGFPLPENKNGPIDLMDHIDQYIAKHGSKKLNDFLAKHYDRLDTFHVPDEILNKIEKPISKQEYLVNFMKTMSQDLQLSFDKKIEQRIQVQDLAQTSSVSDKLENKMSGRSGFNVVQNARKDQHDSNESDYDVYKKHFLSAMDLIQHHLKPIVDKKLEYAACKKDTSQLNLNIGNTPRDTMSYFDTALDSRCSKLGSTQQEQIHSNNVAQLQAKALNSGQLQLDFFKNRALILLARQQMRLSSYVGFA
tara:strand:- start:134 stop:1519 length:1386 start_codon:yes stop_codon:yes gene_type:complete